MPHDRDGKLVEVGDRVDIPCVIKSISMTEEYCNVMVETVQPMHPGDSKNSQWLNAKQVLKVEQASNA